MAKRTSTATAVALIVLWAASSSFTTANAKECTVAYSAGQDDSPAILAAFDECREDSVITFAAHNYSAYTPVTLDNLKNVTVQLQGNLLLPDDISTVQQKINTTNNKPSTYATPWFYIQGEDVYIHGSNQSDWGAFHGFGQQWWDRGNRTLRPQLATFNVTNGLLSGLKVIYPVAWGWNIPGKNVHIENHYVLAKPRNSTRDSTVSFPFNTDGFNLSGQNITVDGYTGWNGDDCISVVNGARDILVKNGYCGFSSHGLSIGSLGKNGSVASVHNVRFDNWTMDGAVYGARYKSWTGGNGEATNVTWANIHLVNVSTGIFITQNYYDQDKGPRPPNPSGNSTHIDSFTFQNFTGTLGTNWTDGTCISSPCWNHVQGAAEVPQAIIFDLYPDTATNLQFVDIDIKDHNGSTPEVTCNSSALAKGEQDTLGFKCSTGDFAATEIKKGGSNSGKNNASRSVASAAAGLLGAFALFSLLI